MLDPTEMANVFTTHCSEWKRGNRGRREREKEGEGGGGRDRERERGR